MADSLKVGIVANEFFDPAIGRVGGFGWAAKKQLMYLVSIRPAMWM
ncbi:hypothetical protein [Rhodohalobacter sp. 8-1]